MRATFISMCAVLIASLALCGVSMYAHFTAIDEMNGLCEGALECVKADDVEGARRQVKALRKSFDDTSAMLELLSDHDELHEVLNCIVDARVALEWEDVDDAYQALARMKGVLEHLRDHESMSFANLY